MDVRQIPRPANPDYIGNASAPLPAALARRGDRGLLHRPGRERAGARLRSVSSGAARRFGFAARLSVPAASREMKVARVQGRRMHTHQRDRISSIVDGDHGIALGIVLIADGSRQLA